MSYNISDCRGSSSWTSILFILACSFGRCIAQLDSSHANCTYNALYLNCSHRGYTRIPENLPVDAVQMDFSNNEISRLEDGAFDGITQVFQLDLRENEIKWYERCAVLSNATHTHPCMLILLG
eukprot:m.315691 g.315691  ORF g.315691 m.315691 type:complete len:123 (-) comp20279_c0_seq7:1903-2271(-)